VRAVVQRVSSARVVVDGEVVGEVGPGLCVLLGVSRTDGEDDAERFTEAGPPEQAEPLYERFCAALKELGIEVATGRFGARMAVELVNNGPVTIVLDA
jgi:D-tyrosyl-tRNA(Tyr) deacylase